MELVGPSRRVYAGIVIEIFWCIGLYLLNIIAFLIRDWNLLQMIIVAFAPMLVAYFWYVVVFAKINLSYDATVIQFLPFSLHTLYMALS